MNIIEPQGISADAACRKISDPIEIADSFAGYLTDESKLDPVSAHAIYFPTTTEEVVFAIVESAKEGSKLVTSGGRTGIVGGAVVTEDASVISLERLKAKPVVRFDMDRDQWVARVAAGMTVAELGEALRSRSFDIEGQSPEEELFYPIDPTETSAQIGGAISTNASGARTFFYGPMRDWVEWIRVVLADGRVLDLRRGDVTASGLEFVLRDISGGERLIELPDVEMPATKCTAGYFISPNMDAVDLFIGSEGTLGIITEAELRLTQRPKQSLYLCQYFSGEDEALAFVLSLAQSSELSPLAIEYFDPKSIEFLRRKRKEEGASSGVPDLPDASRAIVYSEYTIDDEKHFENVAASIEKLVASVGGAASESWAGLYRKDLDRMKEFRHALPETVNSIIGQRKVSVPEIHKIGTDMAVPIENVKEIMSFYRGRLDPAGLEYVIFGHIGDGHVHVNILPRNKKELSEGKSLYLEFAREAVRLGGSVSAEHGIGIIKREFLLVQYSDAVIERMRHIKLAFDPQAVLNPSVLFL